MSVTVDEISFDIFTACNSVLKTRRAETVFLSPPSLADCCLQNSASSGAFAIRAILNALLWLIYKAIFFSACVKILTLSMIDGFANLISTWESLITTDVIIVGLHLISLWFSAVIGKSLKLLEKQLKIETSMHTVTLKLIVTNTVQIKNALL